MGTSLGMLYRSDDDVLIGKDSIDCELAWQLGAHIVPSEVLCIQTHMRRPCIRSSCEAIRCAALRVERRKSYFGSIHMHWLIVLDDKTTYHLVGLTR